MQLMRGAVALLDGDQFQPYADAVFRAIWVEGQNMGDPDVVARVLGGQGFDVAGLLQQINDPAVKERLRQITERAIERGVRSEERRVGKARHYLRVRIAVETE